GQRSGQQCRKVAAMKMIVGRAKGGLDFRSQRSALQSASVVPPPLVDRKRTHARRVHRMLEPEPMEQPRRIGAYLDAGAYLTELRCLFVDGHVAIGLQHEQPR